MTGTWTVTSSCLNLAGDVDMQALFALSCPTGHVTGTLQVTGTWTAKANGTFEDGTITAGTEYLSLPAECRDPLAGPCDLRKARFGHGGRVLRYCVLRDSADGGCACAGTVKQTGSMGFVTSDPQTNGNYTTAGTTITNSQDSSQYSYCVRTTS